MLIMFVLLLLRVSPQKIPILPRMSPRNIVAITYSNSPVETKPKDEKADNKESYLHRMLKPDVLPVWVGSVATLVAGIIGVVTLIKISKQTGAAVETAKAAELSARTGYITQLPKLAILKRQLRNGSPYQVDTNRLFQPAVSIAVTNWGGTPAFVRSWNLSITYEGSTESITDEPIGVVISPNEEHWLPNIHSKEHLSIIESELLLQGKTKYIVNGNIWYEDLFGNKSKFSFCTHLGYWNDKVTFKDCETNTPAEMVNNAYFSA
jgi:hypothetical protein